MTKVHRQRGGGGRPISSDPFPQREPLRPAKSAEPRCVGFLSAKGRVCVRPAPGARIPPPLAAPQPAPGGEGVKEKKPQDPPARPPNCSESSANTSPRGAGKHRWKKGSGEYEPSGEPEREGRRSSRGRVFAGGGWSQWRADVSVAGAARGLRACVRSSP